MDNCSPNLLQIKDRIIQAVSNIIDEHQSQLTVSNIIDEHQSQRQLSTLSEESGHFSKEVPQSRPSLKKDVVKTLREQRRVNRSMTAPVAKEIDKASLVHRESLTSVDSSLRRRFASMDSDAEESGVIPAGRHRTSTHSSPGSSPRLNRSPTKETEDQLGANKTATNLPTRIERMRKPSVILTIPNTLGGAASREDDDDLRSVRSSRKLSNISSASVASLISNLSANRPAMSDLQKAIQADEHKIGLELLPVWKSTADECLFKRNSRLGSMWVPQTPKHILACRRGSTFSITSSMSSRLKQRCCGKLIIHPSSQFKLVWDIIGMTLMVYDLIVIPLSAFSPPAHFFTSLMVWVTLLFWTCDVIVCCHTGFTRNGILELRPEKILKNYFGSWFMFDIIVLGIDWSLTMFDQVDEEGALGIFQLGRTARIVRMLRLLRLLRLLKVHGKVSEVLEAIQSEYFRIILNIVKLVVWIMMANHLVACGWFAIGSIPSEDNTWVIYNGLTERSLGYQYTTSLHWSLTQFTPASMEVSARNTLERVYNVIVLIIAMVTFSSFISSITNATTMLRNLDANESNKRNTLFKYLKEHDIPMSLASDVWSWVLNTQDTSRHRIHEKDVVVLSLLPKSLRANLRNYVYGPVVKKHPFFKKLAELKPMGTIKLYELAMTEVAVGVGQELFMSHDVAERMYFLVRGVMHYHPDVNLTGEASTTFTIRESLESSKSKKSSCSTRTNQVGVGEWMCEAALWLKWKHQGQMSAPTHCELYGLSASKFGELVQKDLPSFFEVCQYARYFLRQVALQEIRLTDVWADTHLLWRITTEAFEDWGCDSINSESIIQQSDSYKVVPID